MRVVVIGQMLNTNHADKIVGGIQTVERLHVTLLLDLAHDVTFVASADTTPFQDHHFLKYRLTTQPSEEGVGGTLTKSEKGRLSKGKTVEIREMIEEINPHLIICHSYSSSHVKMVSELSRRIPSLIFVHQTPAVAMDISMIAKVQAYLKLTNHGGKLMMTSPYQRDMWREVLTRRIASGSSHFSFLTVADVHRIYDRIVPSAYMNHVKIEPADTHFVVVSRPDPAKNVATLLDLLGDMREVIGGNSETISLKFFIAWPGQLSDNPYWVNQLHPRIMRLVEQGFHVPVYQNAPRTDVLKGIATARAMFLPGPNESSPMTLMEAATYGVWPITFARGREVDGARVIENAASTMLLPGQLSVIDAFGARTDAVRMLGRAIKNVHKLELCDRINYRDEVLKDHSYFRRKDDLAQAISKLLLDHAKCNQKQLIQF